MQLNAVHRRNAMLTIGVGLPLLAAFVGVINFYPVPVWNLFCEAADLNAGHRYYVLMGRRGVGPWEEMPAVQFSGVLYNRLFMFASYTDRNSAFNIDSPHPKNVRPSAALSEDLPRGARMPELLDAWKEVYNRRLPDHSPKRLSGLRLEARRWPGGAYGDHNQPDYSWESSP